MHDVELLRHYVAERSDAAFTELVRRHIDFVYATAARQSRPAHRAEDVTQIVFAALARKAPLLVGRAEIVGWLYTTVCYAVRDMARRESRRERREREAAMSQEILADAATEKVDWEKMRAFLDGALQQLSETDRAAILLRFFRSLPFAEVGAGLRVSEEAARKRVDRALDKLRRLLARRGIKSTAGAIAVAISAEAGVAAPAGLAASVAGAALASGPATAAAASGLSIISLMSTPKIISTLSAFAVLLAIGTAVIEVRRADRAADLHVSAERENRALSDRARQIKEQLAAARQQQALLQSQVDALRVDVDARVAAARAARAAAQPGGKANAPSPSGPLIEALNQDPEVLRLSAAVAATNEMRRIHAAQLEMELTAAEIELMEAIIHADLRQTVRWWGEDASPSFRNSGISEQGGQQLRALIGDARYNRLEEIKNDPHRRILDVVARESLHADEPLSVEQARRLTQIFEIASAESSSGRANKPGEVRWDSALAEAESILSARQWTALREIAEADGYQTGKSDGPGNGR